MKTFFNLPGIMFLLIFTLGCSQSYIKEDKRDQYPEWINRPYSGRYVEALYITGVGSGDSRDQATANALGKISQVFQSEIIVDQTLIENFHEADTGSFFMSTSKGQTNIKSHQVLKNVNIDRYYFDKEEGIYYAFAYLNRLETSQIYEEEIHQNHLRIQDYYHRYIKSANKLSRWVFINKAAALSEINEILNQKHLIISKVGAPIEGIIPRSRILKERDILLKDISMRVIHSQQSPLEIRYYIEEKISQLGFQLKEDNSDFEIHCHLDTQQLEMNPQSKYIYYHWVLTIEMRHHINHQLLRSFNFQDRTAGLTMSQAKVNLLRKVKKVIATDFMKKFIAYLKTF